MKLLRFLAVALFSGSVFASPQATLALHLDNDGIFGTDEDYTNGIFFTYTSHAITPASWAEPLSLSAWGLESLDKWEISLGHKMWTPSDITLEKPQPNERPYAGYLHAEFSYLSLNPQLAQRVSLTLGTTGNNSLSASAQKFVHHITNSEMPNGWDYQVQDKLTGTIGYLGHVNWTRTQPQNERQWELSSVSELNLGNFRSDVSAGIMVRWGQDLTNNFGSAQITAEKPFLPGMIGVSDEAWFVFAGIEARYRFNDLTIEGQRPLDGLEHDAAYYKVTVEPVQATAVCGVAWYGPKMGASLSLATNSAEYKESRKTLHPTGSFTLYAFF